MSKGGGTDVLYYSLHACTFTQEQQGNVRVLSDCEVLQANSLDPHRFPFDFLFFPP